MQIVAKCQKCGREFITEPAKYPAFDPYWRRDKYGQRPHVFEECGGEIVPINLGTGSESATGHGQCSTFAPARQ